jgi:hypothetical protein
MSGITQHEISEKLNLSQHHCENLKSRIIWVRETQQCDCLH